jgi:hypothetical protein
MTTPTTQPWSARLQAILLVLLLALPYIQRTTRIFDESPLSGSETPPPRPVLSVTNWFNGSFSQASERYMAYKIGFRGHGIKLQNQINYALFHRATGTRGTPVTLGREGWIYETEYVKRYISRDAMTLPDRARFAADLKALQQELEKRGIVFALVIAPSKAEIIPDFLPPSVIAKRAATQAPNAYQLMIKRLQTLGVRVIDGHAYFKTLREQGTPHLFTRGGTHWSYAGCFQFCRYLIAQLHPTMPDRIRVPELSEGIRKPAQGSDRDLALLLNLFVCDAREDLLPYPDLDCDPLPMAQRPDILLVGDSFVFTILDAFNRARIAARTDLLYYFRRIYHYPTEDVPSYLLNHGAYTGPALDPNQLDWERYLMNRDIVLLEMNEIMLPDEGWGFVPHALAYLRSLPPVE